MIPIVRSFFKLSALALLLALSGCETDPSAEDFAAPKLGAVSAVAEAYRIRVSCPVSGDTSGIRQFGVQVGSASANVSGGILWRDLPAVFEDGALRAEAKGLDAETDYSVKVFISNGDEIRTSETSVRTAAGTETVDLPDPVFRRYILAHFDTNGDDVLTLLEAQQITEITVCTDSIYSLRGIEKMGRLQILDANGSPYANGHLLEIDLSGNPMLERCYLESNKLHAADLSGLPRLREVSLNLNPLDSIDFSYNPRLTNICLNGTPQLGRLPEMTQFDLYHLHISGLARFMPEDYLTQFPHLISLNIDDFRGARLDLSCNSDLESLWMHNTPGLEELDLRATNLRDLYIGENPRLRRVYVRTGTVLRNLEKDAHTEIVYVDR